VAKHVTMKRVVSVGGLILLGLILVFSSYTIIEPGHRGVVVRLGSVEGAVLGEGFHLIIPPMVRQVIPVDVRTKKLEVYTEAASSDLQTVQVNGVLNYHVDPQAVNVLYQRVGLGYESILIEPALQEAIKAATAGFRIERILSERAILKAQIQDVLSERLGPNNIIIDQFSLANVEFSDEFNAAIERKQVAEQSALQKQYELQSAEKEVEIVLARAEGEKKSAVIAAEGRAEARRIEAEAEAKALQLIAVQIKNNPDLIKYEWAIRLSPTIRTVLLPTGQDLILDGSSLVTGAVAP